MTLTTRAIRLTPVRNAMASQRRKILWTLLAVVAVLLPFLLSTGQLTTATFVVIAAIGALGLNVVTGYTGQISLGHAFFMAVGAYTGAVLGADHNLNALIWIPAAGVIAAVCGAVIGPTALRLRGFYLAIVTIGLIFIGQHILINVPSISGGPQGRAFPPVLLGPLDFSDGQQVTIAGVTLDRDGLYYFLSLGILVLSLVFVANLRRARVGRAMLAVRERELAASVLGVNVARTKVAAFVVSSFLAGICGALYASYLSFAQPGQWDLNFSIQFVAAIIVGGMGTVFGPLLGAAVVFALPSIIQTLPFVAESGTSGISSGDLSSIVYGVLIVVFLVVEPRGLAGLGARLGSLRYRREIPATAGAPGRVTRALSTNPIEGGMQ